MNSDTEQSMNGNASHTDIADDDGLLVDISDEALEAIAEPGRGPAVTIPNAPTISLLIACCSYDSVA
jgi:hypothetical protein